MPLLSDCKESFGTNCLYEVLGVSEKKTASAATIKKAYYAASMKWHPDRWSSSDDEQKEKATRKFQILNKAYEVLSDKEKKSIYDETGAVDDEGVLSEEDLISAWRKIFKKVTKKDIDEYMEKYRGSEEEKDDIIAAYNRWKGDMEKVVETVIGGEDEGRVTDIIRELIQDGTLKETKKFKASTSDKKVNARKRKAAEEAKEAEQELEKIKKKEGNKSLEELILARNSSRMNAFDAIAAKYGNPEKPQKKKKAKK